MPAYTQFDVERLEALLRQVAAKKHIRHVVMAVERGDGTMRWSGAAGTANPDGRAMQSAIPWFIASIDKMFHAALAMKLSECGRLNLDATLATYLPRSVTAGLHRHEGHDYSDEITVRHVLAHTSGLADWLEDSPTGGRSVIDQVVRGGDRSVSIEEIAGVVRDQLKPHFPPRSPIGGAKARYSDTNYMLLIGIIEAVTGKPLHEVLLDLLFRPLGMRNSYVAGLSIPLAPTPAPATLHVAGRPLQVPLLLRSIRGVYSTTADTLRFLRALIRGGLFEQPDTFAAMQQSWSRFGFPLDRAALRTPGWPIEYSLGLMRFQLPWLLSPLRRMPAVFGHTGSTGCWCFYCPTLDLMLSGNVSEATAGALPYRVVPKLLRASAG